MTSYKRLIPIFASLTVISYLSLLSSQPIVDRLVDEDGFFESLTVIFFLVACVCFGIAFYRSMHRENRPNYPLLKRLSYLVLVSLFLFGAGEEISWGQRIFHIETPEALREINEQEEINVHNLEIFQNHSAIFNTDRLFALFWGTLMVGIPLFAYMSPKLREWLDKLVPIFPWWLGLLFIFNYLAAKGAKDFLIATDSYQGLERTLAQGVVEVKEAVFSLLFALVGVYLIKVMVKAIHSQMVKSRTVPAKNKSWHSRL